MTAVAVAVVVVWLCSLVAVVVMLGRDELAHRRRTAVIDVEPVRVKVRP